MSQALIELEHVSRSFETPGGTITAVDGVSLAMQPAEILCLVGESGCGKTTTGRLLTGLSQPTSGRVLFEGNDVFVEPSAMAVSMSSDMPTDRVSNANSPSSVPYNSRKSR